MVGLICRAGLLWANVTFNIKRAICSSRSTQLHKKIFLLGAGSAVSSDSGVWTGGEGGAGGDLSPRSRHRPRNLEMVMRGSHNFQLRELQDDDFDIMGNRILDCIIILLKMLQTKISLFKTRFNHNKPSLKKHNLFNSQLNLSAKF